MDSFTNSVRNILVDEFGIRETKQKPKLPQKVRKKTSKTFRKLRSQKRKIRMALKKAKRDNKGRKYIAKLHYIRRNIIRSMNRIRKHEEKIQKADQLYRNQKAFNTDHNRFAKKLFSESKSSTPTFSSDTCEDFFRNTYSDEFRDTRYTPPNNMSRPNPPTHTFKTGPPSWQEFSEMLKRRSNGSAPGPNGLPNIVYKKIPFCARTIYNIICKCFTSGTTPTSFGIAYISQIAKKTGQT